MLQCIQQNMTTPTTDASPVTPSFEDHHLQRMLEYDKQAQHHERKQVDIEMAELEV